MDDPHLLRRFVEHRREEDFAELVNRHLGLVYRVALRRTAGDAHLAEDVSQQVFVALSQQAVSVQDHPVLEGWLYVTTSNLAAKAVRSEQRRRHREEEASVMNEPNASLENEADLPRLRAELGRVLDALPERDRHAVLLRFYSNQPYAEIGAVLKVSENAARQRVDRALERMKTLFARRRIVSTSAALAALLAGEATAAVPAGLAGTVTTAAVAAGAAAAPAGLLYFLKLMGTAKTAATLAGVVVCLATGVAIYEYSEGRAALADNASALEESRGLARDVRVANEQLKNAERLKHEAELASEAAQKRLTELNTQQASANAVKLGGKAKTMDPQQAQMELLLTNPEYVAATLAVRRLELGFEFGALYKKLGLTPQQIAGFEEIYMAYYKDGIDAQATAYVQGIGSSREIDPERETYAQPEMKEARAKFLAKARDLLGESGWEKLVSLSPETSARSKTNQLAKDLFYTSTPLTTIQADALTALLSKNARAGSPGFFARQTFDWDTVLIQASGILSTSQAAVLKQRVDVTRLNQEVLNFMAKAAATSP